MLTESARHAIKALDEWNASTGDFGDFVGHMHKAWLYMLHAEFCKNQVKYFYRKSGSIRYEYVDGDKKAWELGRCLQEKYPDVNNPIRKNLELFIRIRNKLEHRFEGNLTTFVDGKAHALVVNYANERVEIFGEDYGLAGQLRFPIFLESLTGNGIEDLRELARKLPSDAKSVISKFESGLTEEVVNDPRYDYRVALIPQRGAKSEADVVFNFVNRNELGEDALRRLDRAGRSGTVVIFDKYRDVADPYSLLPEQVVSEVNKNVDYAFNLSDHTSLWKKYKVRPPEGVDDPTKTDSSYCVWNAAFRRYVYAPNWVNKIVREVGTFEKYEKVFGRPPRGFESSR